MTMQQQEVLDDDSNLVDSLIFLKNSTNKIALSTLIFLLLGVAYHVYEPNKYEASVTLELASVAGELVESQAALFEKLKIPLYFSTETRLVCGYDGENNSQPKFSDKIKPSINKSASLISFVTVANTREKAENCLDTVYSEIRNKHSELARPVIDQKKLEIQNIVLRLKIEGNKLSANEIKELQTQVNIIEMSLIPPNTRPTTLVAPIYSSSEKKNIPLINKLLISLLLGSGFGIIISISAGFFLMIRSKMGARKLRL